MGEKGNVSSDELLAAGTGAVVAGAGTQVTAVFEEAADTVKDKVARQGRRRRHRDGHREVEAAQRRRVGRSGRSVHLGLTRHVLGGDARVRPRGGGACAPGRARGRRQVTRRRATRLPTKSLRATAADGRRCGRGRAGAGRVPRVPRRRRRGGRPGRVRDPKGPPRPPARGADPAEGLAESQPHWRVDAGDSHRTITAASGTTRPRTRQERPGDLDLPCGGLLRRPVQRRHHELERTGVPLHLGRRQAEGDAEQRHGGT